MSIKDWIDFWNSELIDEMGEITLLKEGEDVPD